MMDERDAEIEALKDALAFAVSVIQNYAMDIRNSEWAGVDLVAKGFCQGSIYLGAEDQIVRMRQRRMDEA